MQYKGKNEELLLLKHVKGNSPELLMNTMPSGLTFIWFREAQEIVVDYTSYPIKANQILCLTEFHHLETKEFRQVRFIRFNPVVLLHQGPRQ